MIDFQVKKNINRIIYSKLVLVLLIILTIIILIQLYDIYFKYKISQDNTHKTAASLEILREKEIYLKSEIARLESKSGIEEEIREKYGVIKPGEEIIVILNDKNEGLKSQETNKGFWSRILSLFR